MHTKFGVHFRSNWISKRKILRNTRTPASSCLVIFVNTTMVNIIENDSIWKRFCQNSFNKFNCYVFICQFIHLIPLKFADILKNCSSFELEKAVKLSFLLFVVPIARSMGRSLARLLACLLTCLSSVLLLKFELIIHWKLSQTKWIHVRYSKCIVNHRSSIALCISEYLNITMNYSERLLPFRLWIRLILMSYGLNWSLGCCWYFYWAIFSISFAWLHSISLLNVWTRSMSSTQYKMTNEYKRPLWFTNRTAQTPTSNGKENQNQSPRRNKPECI